MDLPGFLARESPFWDELELMLEQLEQESFRSRDLAFLERFYYLAERAGADLVRLRSFSAERETQNYLEDLVARAHSEMHDAPERSRLPNLLALFFVGFPQAFRRRFGSFRWSLAATLVGALFGILVIALDPAAKPALMPFPHLLGDPSDRVAMEESQSFSEYDQKTTFSAQLMTHNTRVAMLTFALGMTFALGTYLILFYNGAKLGAVCFDYIQAGESVFLAGWLLPHGSVEIPAILIAGQAGILLGSTLLGAGGAGLPLAERLRQARGDLLLLFSGIVALLIWAGLIEAFFSQHHEPSLPYAFKIAFGTAQLALLALYLSWAGRSRQPG